MRKFDASLWSGGVEGGQKKETLHILKLFFDLS